MQTVISKSNDIVMEKYDKQKQETFIYPKSCQLVTCLCGLVINGEHTCSNDDKVFSSVRILECHYSPEKKLNGIACQICKEKENFKKYENQWYQYRDG